MYIFHFTADGMPMGLGTGTGSSASVTGPGVVTLGSEGTIPCNLDT